MNTIKSQGTLNNGHGLFTVPAGGQGAQLFQVTGANPGDPAVVAVSGNVGDLIFTANVDSQNAVTVRAYNPSAAPITLPPYTSAVVCVFQGI